MNWFRFICLTIVFSFSSTLSSGQEDLVTASTLDTLRFNSEFQFGKIQGFREVNSLPDLDSEISYSYHVQGYTDTLVIDKDSIVSFTTGEQTGLAVKRTDKWKVWNVLSEGALLFYLKLDSILIDEQNYVVLKYSIGDGRSYYHNETRYLEIWDIKDTTLLFAAESETENYALDYDHNQSTNEYTLLSSEECNCKQQFKFEQDSLIIDSVKCSTLAQWPESLRSSIQSDCLNSLPEGKYMLKSKHWIRRLK